MAFPHPESRQNQYRNEAKPNGGRVIWNLVKRAIDIAEYGYREDDVNPAKNRTLGGFLHLIHFLRESTLKPVVLPEVLPGQSWESSY